MIKASQSSWVTNPASWRSALGSVILHFLILIFLLIHSHSRSRLKTETQIDIDFVRTGVENLNPLSVLAQRKVKLRQRTKSAPGGLSSFLKPSPALEMRAHSEVDQGGDDFLKDDAPADEWGKGSKQFKKIEQYSLMEKIHHQVDGLLYYPAVLANHGIEGVVNARLALDTEGRCDWSSMTVSSGSPYFRIYILDVLKTLCRQNYRREVAGRRLTNVDLSFQFSVTEHDDKNIKEAQNRVVGNALLFFRNSQQSVAQWHLGPLTGLFPLPIVNLDFNWLKENWETVVEKKDLYRDYRGL